MITPPEHLLSNDTQMSNRYLITKPPDYQNQSGENRETSIITQGENATLHQDSPDDKPANDLNIRPELKAKLSKLFSGKKKISLNKEKEEQNKSLDNGMVVPRPRMSVIVRKAIAQANTAGSITENMMASKSDQGDDNDKSKKSLKNPLLSKILKFRSASSKSKRNTQISFEEFVNQSKGVTTNDLETTYPTYKVDKRLGFLGKDVIYPKLIFPYNSSFRRCWNILMIFFILYGLIWYTYFPCFQFGAEPNTGIITFEILLFFFFFGDLVLNLRTTYSNQNNEEIIDHKMIFKNYISSRLFWIDIVTLIPLSEILLISVPDSTTSYKLYSLFKLIKLLRIMKIEDYLSTIYNSISLKVTRILVFFFLAIHWMTCIWFLVCSFETSGRDKWYPGDLVSTYPDESYLAGFYDQTMDPLEVYSFTLLAIFMITIGQSLQPVDSIQSFFTILLGLFGAILMAFIFGSMTFLINRMNMKQSLYEDKADDLKQKLNLNKVPENLKHKVMEYFTYTWKKNRILSGADDFSELSIPLQRDLAFFKHQELVRTVPLFKDLTPVEILGIIQKFRTVIYMPGDRIIRKGDKGTEMFFIIEGIVEVLIPKKNPLPGQAQNDAIFLEKGAFFGEIALISNSRRTTDVNAFEFCILESFSKADYENLENEFHDIGPRLRAGVRHFKQYNGKKIIGILSKLPLFEGFTNEELDWIVTDYLETIFVDTERIVIKPKPVL